MSVSIYPQYPIPDTPVEVNYMYNIQVSQLSFNFDYVYQQAHRTKRQITLKYSWLTQSEIEILRNFYHQSQLYNPYFYFIYPTKINFNNEFIAKVVDRNQLTYVLPVINYDSIVVKVNGNQVSNYQISEYQYPLLKITFTGLNIGDLITCDYTNGRPVIYCRFDQNSIGIQHLVAGYSNITDLKLIEVLNEQPEL